MSLRQKVQLAGRAGGDRIEKDQLFARPAVRVRPALALPYTTYTDWQAGHTTHYTGRPVKGEARTFILNPHLTQSESESKVSIFPFSPRQRY